MPHAYHPTRIQGLLKLKARSFRFTFVRHPFTRFASAYKWLTERKEGGELNSFDLRQLEVIQRFSDINAFCRALPELLVEDEVQMIHFYPQSLFVYSGEEPLVDFVGKYESLEEDCRRLNDQHSYSLQIAFGPNNKNSRKSGLQEPVESLSRLGLTDSGVDSLESFYNNDFRLFNY
ncbi:hypothetical protein GCM10027297_20720 [Parahaliea aestuarii]